MKIAIPQLNFTVGAIKSNRSKIIANVERARVEGAELVVFPEYAVSGAPGYELFNLPNFIEQCEESIEEIAKQCEGISVIVGLPLAQNNRTISAAAVIVNGEIVGYIGKKNIINPDELGYISPSFGYETVQIGDKRVAVVVGKDILSVERFGGNVDIVINICSHRYSRGIIERRHEYFRKLAFSSDKDVLFVNQIGGNSDVVNDGSSTVFSKKGLAIALLNSFEEDFQVVETDSDIALRIPVQSRVRNTHDAIKLGVRDYFKKNGFTTACLGLSGGIDSAVVLAVMVEALGAENIRVLMMPSQFSSEHSVNDAIAMAEGLGVEYNVIPITEAFKCISESMIPVIGGRGFDVTEENVQARVRMTMLMALSNKLGHILLNTSNKSEAAVGYDTLYGDSAGSLAVIGDLYKIEVYELARYLNRDRTVIPEAIISKEPSAELRPDQKDTDSLPPYEVLDALLYRFIEEGQLADEIIEAGFESKMVHKTLNQLRGSAFKRYQACPVIRVSRRPFESSYKLPLVEKFEL